MARKKVSPFENAYNILSNYTGQNVWVQWLAQRNANNPYSLSEFDITYINENHDYTPKFVNKTVKITNEFGLKLQDKYDIEFIPQKIFISCIIGEMGNSWHAYVKWRQSMDEKLIYVSKHAVVNELEVVDYNKIDINFDRLKSERKLKEHQKVGVKFLIGCKKVILADAPGVGKSCEAVCASILGNYKKILIICPASLKTNWRKELSYFMPKEDITIINGNEWKEHKKVTIINYDIVKNFYKLPMENDYEKKTLPNGDGTSRIVNVPKVKRNKNGELEYKQKKSRKKIDIEAALHDSPLYLEKFDCVIIDEAHKLSNNKSQRYQLIDDFLNKSKIQNVWLLTGTPITKSTKNYYYILKLINANITKEYRRYMFRYCGAKEVNFGHGKVLQDNGSTNLEELMEQTKHLYLRRELKDLEDVVEKNILTRYYELNPRQKAEYERLWDEYVEAQSNRDDDDIFGDGANEDYRQLVEGMLVRQFLAREMIPNTIQMTDEYLEDDEKVVIMCNFADEIAAFKKHYGDKAVVYDGNMTTAQKDKAVERFMNDDNVKVFVGNIVAAGVGLTLTRSHILIFNSFSWAAYDNLQAMDRVHRLNQTEDVSIYYQLFDDSISEHMFETVMRKEMVLKTVIVKEKEKNAKK